MIRAECFTPTVAPETSLQIASRYVDFNCRNARFASELRKCVAVGGKSILRKII